MVESSRTAVLLDKHPLWLEAVECVLERIDVRVAGKATSPNPALELIEAHRPDLFVTGIEMGEGHMDGIACISQARQRVSSLRAVVLSAHTSHEYIDKALDAGAVAYVVKSAHPDDLASAIRQAFDHSVFYAGARPAPETEVNRRPGGETADLTSREQEILKLVAEGHPNAKLAKMLWVTEQTVKFHLSNVYRKLGVSNRTQAARWAQVNGLLPTAPREIPNERRMHLVAG